MTESEGPRVEQDTLAPGRTRRRMNAQEARERHRRLMTWGFSIAFGVLLVNSIVGENGYLATVRAHREEAALAASVTRLQLENRSLQDERQRLEEDPAALEETARRRLSMIREGETLVIIKEAPPASPSPQTR